MPSHPSDPDGEGASPRELGSPKALLERFGLRPKRSFGQNFLADAHLSRQIAELATPEPGLEVLELGAGLGALTVQLLGRGARVIAVERDRDLVPALGELFAGDCAAGRLRIVEDDAKQVDFRGVFEGPPARRVIAGNLPYQITGPLLERVVGVGRELRRAVFLVQKEVADRLAAKPGSPEYGALSVFTQAQFEVQRAFLVRRGAFYPQPNVDSAVVALEPRPVPVSEETAQFRSAVKSAFAARRKTLRNAWSGLGPAERIAEAAARAGIDLELRGETLGVEQFARFAAALGDGQPASGEVSES